MSDSQTESSASAKSSDSHVEILAAINHLSEQFEQKLAIDEVKDRQIKQLHAELLEHRQGLMQSIIQPLVMQIIRLRDDISRRAEGLAAKLPQQSEDDRLIKEMHGFRDDLLMLLEGAGVLPFEEAQCLFNPARQQSVFTVKSNEPERQGQISQRVNPGYEMNGRMLIKERVRVIVYDKTAAQTVAVSTQIAEPAMEKQTPSAPASNV